MTSICTSIVTYRSDIERLSAAIKSLHCTTASHELVVVDNCSGADYVQQLREIADGKIIEAAENNGFGYGHNIAFRTVSDADYYLVMNPDVEVHEGCIERMLAYLETYKEASGCVPRVQFPDGSPQYLNKRLPSVFDLFVRRFLPAPLREWSWVKQKMQSYEMHDVGYDDIVDVPFASGCFMLLRGELVRQIGGFDERFFMYLEDCDITRRLNEFGPVRYVPDALITHHWERGSHKNLKLFRIMLQSMWRYFQKWEWKWL